MPLTRPYNDTIRERAQCDPEFRRLLTTGVIDNLLAREVAAGKIGLRHTVNSTIGYEKIGEIMGKTPDDIKRMRHPDHDTSVNDLFEIILHIQQHEVIRLEAKICSGEQGCESITHDESAGSVESQRALHPVSAS